jgi:hypothetical protein
VNTKKHLEEVMKDRDAYSAKALELGKDQDLWKGRCNQMAAGIKLVLDLIDLELSAPEARGQPRGVLDKCQHVLGWLQQFVKEAEEYVGSHVLSMVRVHYPLIDFKRFELGYPKEVGPKQADELRIQLFDLSASMMGDINLCETPSPPGQEPASLSQLPETTVSTSQSLVLGSSSAEQSEVVVSTSQTPVAPASSAREAPPSSSGEKAKTAPSPSTERRPASSL